MPRTEIGRRHGRQRLDIGRRRRRELVLLLAKMVLRRVRWMRAVIPFLVLPWAGLVTRHMRMGMRMRMQVVVRVTVMTAIHGLDDRCTAAVDMIFEGQM